MQKLAEALAVRQAYHGNLLLILTRFSGFLQEIFLEYPLHGVNEVIDFSQRNSKSN